MAKTLRLIVFTMLFLAIQASAQTTSGLITGEITDSSGAVVIGAQVDITNQGTGQTRTATSGQIGIYSVPDLPPGIYTISVKHSGFTSQVRENVKLEVNQSDTVDFTLGVAANAQSVQVTGAVPLLNTTSSTLSVVIDQPTTVGLPLNGREFTQLTLLAPGAAPLETYQQVGLTVALGAGGISPSVNGQRGQQNNFTMDGTLNNQVYTSTWAIAPPPDAIQEFAVQSHITDAQFAIGSGANINVVTRSGTNTFHGSAWEFLRNDALDATTFPATTRLPYRQNQYGVYLGGPVVKNHAFLSGYWEGFRSSLSQSVLTSTLTPAMRSGDFSGVLGPQVGTDSLGRPEFDNEIYDPLTSRPDPANPLEALRDPFPGNIIPTSRLNQSTLMLLQKYYPEPNLNVPDNVLPNLEFTGNTTTASDVFGIRLDLPLGENNSIFIRFNRSNQNVLKPQSLPTYTHDLGNYARQIAGAYTHLFNPKTILTFLYGRSDVTFVSNDEPAGEAFVSSLPTFLAAAPPHRGLYMGPQVSLSNGFAGINQQGVPLGPLETDDYHLDLSKVIGNHTLGVGVMYYHLRTLDDAWANYDIFAQNATAQDATAGPTGYGAASLMLGTLNRYAAWAGNTTADQTINWYAWYAQDLWHITRRLAVTAGLRWDYVSPPNYHKIVSGLDVLTGQYLVTGAVPPFFPTATARRDYFIPQYNGYEPRLGITYEATNRTVVHGAFAILDDHNNNLIQANQVVRLSWPTGVQNNLTNLDAGIPQIYLDGLPPASSFIGATVPPTAGYSANPANRIPYTMEFNAGVQQQLSNSLVLKLDYVGSLGRFQILGPVANTALVPGPGPISLRAPYPQYGGPIGFEWDRGPSSYNALQALLRKSMSSGLLFMASYTWSKSMDWESDANLNVGQNFYDLANEWGPSDYSIKNMFVLSGLYDLPVGRGKRWLSSSNGVVQSIVGNWTIGTIVTLNSGIPFYVQSGGDLANTGAPYQRANRTGANPYASDKNYTNWLNKAAFAPQAPYTFGNERRNDLAGPAYRNVDFNAVKDFALPEHATLQFRAEFFNSLNFTNYSQPDATISDGTFGQILSAAGSGREIQFALKVMF